MNILVILASYNGEKFIKQQVESILNQRGVNVIIKIFDDQSSDRTKNKVLEMSDERISFIDNIIPSGSAANNFCQAVQSISDEEMKIYDFVSFADQDDIWLPDKIISAVKLMEQERTSLYCSNLILWDEHRDRKRVIKKSFKQKKYDYLFEGGSAGCTYVLSRAFFRIICSELSKVNYKIWSHFSHDWFFYFVARIKEKTVSIDANSYIDYRIHSNNVHGHLNTNSFSSIISKIVLVKDGWYLDHIAGFQNVLDKTSPEYIIYQLYTKSWFSRLYVLLFYNFSLMRSKRKFVIFAFLSLIFFQKKYVLY